VTGRKSLSQGTIDFWLAFWTAMVNNVAFAYRTAFNTLAVTASFRRPTVSTL